MKIKSKICSKCKKLKDLKEFHKAKINKIGYRSDCKECRKIKSKYYLKDNNYKICKGCKEIKLKTEFHVNRGRNDGYHSRCKKCCAEFDHNRKDERNKFYRSKEQLKKRRLRENKKYNENYLYKLEMNIRSSISRAFKKNMKSKRMSSLKYLGCTIQELREYIEKQFKTGMTWDNYGYYGWHIDHIKPIASFSFNNEKDIKKCFNYTNLQPLWMEENLFKRDKII